MNKNDYYNIIHNIDLLYRAQSGQRKHKVLSFYVVGRNMYYYFSNFESAFRFFNGLDTKNNDYYLEINLLIDKEYSIIIESRHGDVIFNKFWYLDFDNDGYDDYLDIFK